LAATTDCQQAKYLAAKFAHNAQAHCESLPLICRNAIR